MKRRSVYPSPKKTPLVAWCAALTLGLMGCVSAPVERSGDGGAGLLAHAENVTEAGGFEDPESATAAFAAAWNAGDLDAVAATFAPDRRDLVRAHLRAAPQQVQSFRVAEAQVTKQCHPRGAYWKTATLQLGPRTVGTGAALVDREIVWLRLQHGAWFMYSL